jgi:DNA repair photolyase
VFVKTNAVALLSCELGRRAWKREQVAVGTATDPYQPVEGKYRLTRGLLGTLAQFKTPASIVTRSPLIIRDLDVLQDLAQKAQATVCFSIATTDPDLARRIEPGVAPPQQRLKALQKLSAQGIYAGVLLAPLLPAINDGAENIRSVMLAAKEHGAQFVWHALLYLGEVTREAFFQYLRADRPELIALYENMYAGIYAPRRYRTEVDALVQRQDVAFAPRSAVTQPQSAAAPQLSLL